MRTTCARREALRSSDEVGLMMRTRGAPDRITMRPKKPVSPSPAASVAATQLPEPPDDPAVQPPRGRERQSVALAAQPARLRVQHPHLMA